MHNQMVITAQIFTSDGELLSDHRLLEKEITIPDELSALGMNRDEQLGLAKGVQQVFLEQQVRWINHSPHKKCPECTHKVWRNGSSVSLFHGFYSEHRLNLSQWKCSSPTCNWSYNPSISSYFKGNISPELMQAQAELGAELPYRKGAKCLKLLAGESRKIHNHMRVRQSTQFLANQVESYVDYQSEKIQAKGEQQAKAKELMVNVDGIHVHEANKKGRSFEGMVVKIYQPDHVIRQDKHHRLITEKQCVGSAKKDKQRLMKRKVLAAAKQAGLNQDTSVTGLADGAKNCWNILQSLATHCLVFLCILDWFHIGKYFKNVENQLPQKEQRLLAVAKKALWHGHAAGCLLWLKIIESRLTQPQHLKKIQALITYITNNQSYLVNYDKRKAQGQAYTSHVAESTVEHYASARLKKHQKMQWTRDGAHGILQIRGAMISGTWEQCCNDRLMGSRFKKCA